MKLIIQFILLCLFPFVACTVDTTGTTSEADVELAGFVVNSNNLPVVSAFIHLYKDLDTVPVDSFLTTDEGRYIFNSVEIGEYKVTASLDDSTYAILQGVEIDKQVGSGTVYLDTLVLQLPGFIKGSVSNYDGKGMLFVYIPGTSFMATVDDSGEFTMSNVAPDSNYTVRFEQVGYSSVTISDVVVLSGDTTYLEPQTLTSNSHPLNFSAVYDSLANVVHFKWSRMERDDIEGYIVKRKSDPQSTKNMQAIHDLIITDTVFTDSVHDTLFSQCDSITLQYQVCGRIKEYGVETGLSKPVIINAIIHRDSSDYQSIIVKNLTNGDSLQGIHSTNINWQYTGKIDSVKLYCTVDGGNSWNPISNKMKNRGSFYWPQILNVQSDNCQIKVLNIHNENIVGLSEFFTINLTPVNNILTDGDFEDGFGNWEPNVSGWDSTLDASVEIDSGIFHVIINNCDEDWKVSLSQKPTTPIYQNYKYEISFKAKSTKFWGIPVAINELNPEYIYYGGTTVYIDTPWVEYHLEYTPDEKYGDPSSSRTVISFNFGNEVGEIWLDDVKMKIVGVK